MAGCKRAGLEDVLLVEFLVGTGGGTTGDEAHE